MERERAAREGRGRSGGEKTRAGLGRTGPPNPKIGWRPARRERRTGRVEDARVLRPSRA